MRKLVFMLACAGTLALGGLALQPTVALSEPACEYEDWGRVSGGHYDCLGTECDPGWCCKICGN